MIIDFHTHTFPDKIAEASIEHLKQKSKTNNFSDGTVGGLSQKLRENGVRLAVVLPVVTNPLKTDRINNSAYEINQKIDQTRVFSFGGMHPDTPDYKGELKRIADMGLKGVKLHPAYQQTPIDDIRYQRIVGYADELGLIVSVHGGIDIGIPGNFATPWRMRKLLDEVKPKKLIVAHTGGWQEWTDVKNYLCGQNVYFDTAFTLGSYGYQDFVPAQERIPVMREDEFLEIVALHGADKILFGTDSPWGDLALQLEVFAKMPLSQADKNKILGENGKKLLKL